MSAIGNKSVDMEVAAEAVNETVDGLVEVGAVSETKGGPWGQTVDLGSGFIIP